MARVRNPDILVVRQALSLELDGVPVVLQAGDTIRAGHPILKRIPADAVKPFEVVFDTGGPAAKPPPAPEPEEEEES